MLDFYYYFAYPYFSWERGLNEYNHKTHSSFFYEVSGFEEITERIVKLVKGISNQCPREILKYTMPTEAYILKNHA